MDESSGSAYNRKTVRKTQSVKVKHKKRIHTRAHTTDLTGRSAPMVAANGSDSRSSSFDSSEPLRSMSNDSASADISDISMDMKQGKSISEHYHFQCGWHEQTTFQNVTNIFKKVKIYEFHYYIWNHNEKCIQNRFF